MANYAQGANFERDVKKHLEGLGYYVIRSAGSHGKIDISAAYPRGGRDLYIQCKRRGALSAEEWNDVIDICEEYKKIPILAKQGDEKIEYFHLYGRKTKRGVYPMKSYIV